MNGNVSDFDEVSKGDGNGATRERFEEYRRTRDRDLRNALVEEHMRLAEFLARRFAHRENRSTIFGRSRSSDS
jgi:hypothetical protein